MTIDVLREPAKGSGYPELINEAQVRVELGSLLLRFASNPKGTNSSLYDVVIRPESYSEIAEAMIRAHPEEAIKAFGAAMKDGIPDPAKSVWYPGIE